jgi:predicted MPP superfamily phosphohydrolase
MNKPNISRRRAIQSLATLAAGAFIKPPSIFGAQPVQNTIRFAVIGDWGTGTDDADGVARQMFSSHKRTPFNFVIAAGDNIYPNGSGRYFRKHFEQPFAQLLSDRVNFYAVLGNHDVEQGRQDQCHYPLFNMAGRNYYTVKQGGGLLELFMLDTTDFDAPQAAWLEQALSASESRWKIAVFHHPIYSSGHKHGSDLRLRKKLEPLLLKYKVNAVFSGHDHIYERTRLQQGIQYFVTGAGGKTRRGEVDLKSPIRQVSYDEDNHFMLIEVNARQIRFQAVNETGKLVDSGIMNAS